MTRTGLVAGTAAAVGVALALPAGAAAHAAAPSRVQAAAVPSWTAQAHSTGAVAGSTTLHLTAVLNLRDAAGAQALAQAVSDPSSPQFRQYVTPQAWRAQFAPTAAQLAQVTSWLASQGFSIGTVPANNRYVSFTGTAAQAEAAFGTTISGYVKDGSTVTANSKPATVPAALSGVLAGVSGLDTSLKAQPSTSTGTPDLKSETAATSSTAGPADTLPPPEPAFANAGPCSAWYGQRIATGLPALPAGIQGPVPYAVCGYKPAQLRGAYGLDITQSVGIDGRGSTVAVVDAYASPNIVSDAQTYASRNDPMHPVRSYTISQNLPTTYTHVDECGGSGWYGEETLDVESVHAMAPGAKILYVGAESCYDDDLNAAVNTVVDNGLAQVITNSYGEPELAEDPAATAEDTQTAEQAAAQGITVLFSSGDDGDEVDNTGTRQTDEPASNPWVTAVGGTSLWVGRQNNWQREIGWGTGKSSLKNGAWSPNPPVWVYGGGGGTSNTFAQPWYQAGVVPTSISEDNGTSTPMRAVPDIAMDGDPQTGMLVGETQTFPDGSVRYGEYRIGGTSLASPLFAGLVAVYDQALQGSGGFLNPLLYALSGTGAYHDIADGHAVTKAVIRNDFVNGTDAADGTVTSLRTENQTQSIFTRPGYDDVTGVGTPNGIHFLLTIESMLSGHGHGNGGHGHGHDR